MPYEYETPGFLEQAEVDEIHQRMLDILPEKWDKSEAGYVYDLTKPTAIELSRLKQFEMNEAIKLIFPMFSSGIYLDYHGEVRKLPRKQAVSSIGKLLVKAEKGCIINTEDMFSTESVNGEPSIQFSATSPYSFEEGKEAEIPIKCASPGAIGNVPANTITLKFTKNDKITSVSNPSPVTGGVDQEDDDAYRDRIVEFDAIQSESFVGNVYDYKRWANEVDGVGGVSVIEAQDDSGLVTLVITDGSGAPATTELCTKVYNHIMSPDDEDARKAPVNAKLSVIPPHSITITVSATVELTRTGTLETAKTELLAALGTYFNSALDDHEIRYSKIQEVFGKTGSVYDYKSVLLNGKTANIPLNSNEIPSISLEGITLTAGTI